MNPPLLPALKKRLKSFEEKMKEHPGAQMAAKKLRNKGCHWESLVDLACEHVDRSASGTFRRRWNAYIKLLNKLKEDVSAISLRAKAFNWRQVANSRCYWNRDFFLTRNDDKFTWETTHSQDTVHVIPRGFVANASLFDSYLGWLIEKSNEVIHVRSNEQINLFNLSVYVKTVTGAPHHGEIASLLEVAEMVFGSESRYTPGSVKNAVKGFKEREVSRHWPRDPKDPKRLHPNYIGVLKGNYCCHSESDMRAMTMDFQGYRRENPDAPESCPS